MTRVLLLLAGIAAIAAISILGVSPQEPPGVFMISAEDGQTYYVVDEQTLADAMALAQEHPGGKEGYCYPEELDPDKIPPEGKEACICYKLTECKGAETRACKRYCRKSKCKCCSI